MRCICINFDRSRSLFTAGAFYCSFTCKDKTKKIRNR